MESNVTIGEATTYVVQYTISGDDIHRTYHAEKAEAIATAKAWIEMVSHPDDWRMPPPDYNWEDVWCASTLPAEPRTVAHVSVYAATVDGDGYHRTYYGDALYSEEYIAYDRTHMKMWDDIFEEIEAAKDEDDRADIIDRYRDSNGNTVVDLAAMDEWVEKE